MKRISVFLLILALMFSCVSCGLGGKINDAVSKIDEVVSIIEDFSLPIFSAEEDVSLPEETSEEPAVSIEEVSIITEVSEEPSATEESVPAEESKDEGIKVTENGSYYDLEHVVAYLSTYKKLPSNYINKTEAGKLGWTGGTVEKYKKGAAIGGDYYGNYEKLLPTTKGVKYTECDLETNGGKPRGAKRLIFSSDWHFYYTDDHYESFTEVVYKDGKVVFK